MAKISIVPWTSRTRPDGTVPLYLVVRSKKQRSIISLNVSLHPRHWNEGKQEVRKTYREYRKLNKHLRDVIEQAESAVLKILSKDGRITTWAVKELLQLSAESTSPDFLEYFQKRIDEFRDRGQHGSVDAYKPVLAKLRDYTKRTSRRSTLTFDELSVVFLRGFHTYLMKVHGNGQNTVTKNLGYLRSVLYIAIREGLFPQEKNPFFQIRLKTKRAKSNRLTIEQIWKLEDLELEQGLLNDVRNYFIFAFYAAGMRVSDVTQLVGDHIRTVDSVHRIEYTMTKTSDPSFSMPLLGKAEQILRFYGWPDKGREEYIFPIMPQHILRGTEEAFKERKRKTALLNKYLKKLANLTDIDIRLTTHVARHSWAAFMDESNLPIQRIQQTLSHKDARTTQVYLHSLRSGMFDDELIRVLTRK